MVEEKLNELEVWLSSIHIVNKQLDKVCMVVDMSITNKAIKGAGGGGSSSKLSRNRLYGCF